MAERLVYGVGVNDSAYPIQRTATVLSESGRPSRKSLWMCPFYKTWAGMLRRCYSVALHARFPTYKDCSVASEWHRFSAFRNWMSRQNWEGNQLDKDILFHGNKVYGPETCVFVSLEVNSFVTDSRAIRGSLPIGVYLHRECRKYYAQLNDGKGKHIYLGAFDTPDKAHMAWLAAKREKAIRLAEKQADPRVAEALINRYSKPQLAYGGSA